MSDRRNLGCIDPHGMYPFPASREVCPKCQAIRARAERASLRRGLPYGWWKNTDVWAAGLSLLLLIIAMVLILAGWFFDIKAWW